MRVPRGDDMALVYLLLEELDLPVFFLIIQSGAHVVLFVVHTGRKSGGDWP